MNQSIIENLIIGAGPAGLAMAGQLRKKGIPFTIIEKSHQVGQAWHDHYDRLHLHTVKEHSNLPHLPFPENFPQYVSKEQFIQYLELYALEMEISVSFGQEVQNIRDLGGSWEVKTQKQSFHTRNVILATGYNRVPHCPEWPRQEKYEGTLLHSRDYKNGSSYQGQQVLVIGIGNTGAEIALDLHEHGAKPFISIRRPVNFVPRDFKGRPTQSTAIFLSKLPNFISDAIAKTLRKITVGDLSPYGIETPEYPASVEIRRFGRIPVVDIGTLDAIKAGHIKVVHEVDHFTTQGVYFKDGQEKAFDSVILATGYRSRLTDFLEGVENIYNDLGHPRQRWFDAYPGLYFLGFQLSSGGILRNIRLGSKEVARHIEASYKPHLQVSTS